MTTSSPAESPSSTSERSPSLAPISTSRGWNFPSPDRDEDDLRVPESMTASVGMRSPSARACAAHLAKHLGPELAVGLGKVSWTFAVRVFGSSNGSMKMTFPLNSRFG